MIKRDSRQRRAILSVLCHSDSHPTADSIYDEVREMIPNISKGTVYRNLSVLKDAGEITELNLGGTTSRYEEKKENHYHFRCEKCGRVFDLDEPVNRALDAKIAGQTGFEVYYHQLEFLGVCKDCRAKTDI